MEHVPLQRPLWLTHDGRPIGEVREFVRHPGGRWSVHGVYLLHREAISAARLAASGEMCHASLETHSPCVLRDGSRGSSRSRGCRPSRRARGVRSLTP